jgi:hypothetical protein
MKLRTRWPWITALLAAAVVLNPIGLDIFYSAFLSGEQLSRNIWVDRMDRNCDPRNDRAAGMGRQNAYLETQRA